MNEEINEEIKLDTTLTPNLVFEGIQNEINRVVAAAKKKADINPKDKINISIVINISTEDLKKYTEAENKRLNNDN